MKKKTIFLPLVLMWAAGALLSPDLLASVRMSNGLNAFETRATYATTNGWALPSGDWTLGIWDNNFQGDGGSLINGVGAADASSNTINLAYNPASGRFIVGGVDNAGNLFGSGGTVFDVAGTLPGAYPGRPTGKFTPRLHIIRRRAGFSEYLVAEAGHAPVLVSSEARTFGATTVGPWFLACRSGWGGLYDSDLEGLFFATTAVSNKDIALMAAGAKPSSVSSISGNLTVYFPLETASLGNTADPFFLANQGSNSSVGFNRSGPVSSFANGPMLRGATAENNTPAQITEPTNVVALNSFQPFQVIRHLNGFADVKFTGCDYGTGTANIEIHFIDVEHATFTAWQTLVTGSAGGGAAFQATISVPKGYWKTIEVRRVNSAGGTGNSNRPNRTWSRWAVGEVVAVWGDSIQGQMEWTNRANIITPNGYTAKYPSDYPNTIAGDTNPLSYGMWNLLKGGGMGGGVQGENSIANNLSNASQCCVGISVVWSGATRLANWNGRVDHAPYDRAKTFYMANGGLNKPNIITWDGNRASAAADDDFYADLDLFKNVLNTDLGVGTWKIILSPVPIMYDGTSALNLHKNRDSCWRWVKDNPQIAQNAGISVDHLTFDGVHPTEAAWDLMGPRWGDAAGYLRSPQTFADPRAGEIVNFYRSGGSLIVEVQLYAGTSLSLENTGNISGLTLSGDNFNTTIPITSATLINNTTFRITPSSLPTGPLKLRYLYGCPGISGNTLAQMGVNNILYSSAEPFNILAIQPIWGNAANNWSMTEGAGPIAGSANLALNRPVMTSSSEYTGVDGSYAVDGNGGTRWGSAFSDLQWICVDLGASKSINRVKLTWEAAYGKSYQIQVSNDANAWTTVYSTNSGTGGVNDIAVSGTGRYVRMNGTERGTGWGYSLWEFEVYGTAGSGGGGTSLGINNSSFESGFNGWSTLSTTGYGAGAWVIDNTADHLNQYPTFSKPLPGTALGNYYLQLQGDESSTPEAVYQNVSNNGLGNTTLQPNTTYTLTVAVGVGTYDWAVNMATIALINGSNPTNWVVLKTASVSDLGFNPYAGNFKDLTLTLTTPTTISGDLTIELLTTHGNPAAGRISFDNVRLMKSP